MNEYECIIKDKSSPKRNQEIAKLDQPIEFLKQTILIINWISNEINWGIECRIERIWIREWFKMSIKVNNIKCANKQILKFDYTKIFLLTTVKLLDEKSNI